MPYGTVNFLRGVPPGETPITCTAGVGTFIVEFGALSRLTGDPVFEDTAMRALKGLWKVRSPVGLVSSYSTFDIFMALKSQLYYQPVLSWFVCFDVYCY